MPPRRYPDFVLFAIRRRPLLPALRVALDVALIGPRHTERARRHVLADHRPSRRVGLVADRHRRDQRRVDARLHPRADRGPVFAIAVVVRGDRARPEVRPLADVGVADVGEVWDLGTGSDLGVLDLDERARLRALAQDRSGAQVGERADAHAVADVGLHGVGMEHPCLIADAGVDHGGVWTHGGARADPGGAVQTRERSDHGVLADLDLDVDDGRTRIDDRHSGEHVAGLNPPLRQGHDLGERDPVVDPEHLARVGDLVRDDRALVRAQDRQHVGQVLLPLRVVLAHLAERLQQRAALEREDPRVDLADVKLELGSVAGGLGLDHALDRAIRGPHDASVAGRVIEHGGCHRRHGA